MSDRGHHDEGHSHGSIRDGVRGGAIHKRRLLLSLALVSLVFVIELVGGLVTNSLALLSDAAHMFTDVLGLGMAAAAIHAASRRASDPQKTFGLYRLEILAALANAVLLFGVGLYILYEAIGRLTRPPEVASGLMLAVALVGLLVNVTVLLALRRGAAESLNVEGAFLEVVADLLGSLGVVAAAIIMQTTGFRLADPLFGVAIGLFVFPRTWRLARKALRILLQAAPPGVELAKIRDALLTIQGVIDVHDLHVWTLTSGIEICSVHVRINEQASAPDVLRRATDELRTTFGIVHPTIQVDPPGFRHETNADTLPCEQEDPHS